MKMRTSSSQEEGAERDFSVLTKELRGENGAVKKLICVRLDANLKEVPDSTFELRADLVLLAMGFVSPLHEGLLDNLGVAFDPRGNVQADQVSYRPRWTRCSLPATCGAANPWWCGRSARAAKRARAVDAFLMGSSLLPR